MVAAILPFSPEVVITVYGVTVYVDAVLAGKVRRREEMSSFGKIPSPSLHMGSLRMRGFPSLCSGAPDSLGPQGIGGMLRVLWTSRGKAKEVRGTGVAVAT